MVYRVKANPKMIKWAREDAGYDFEELPKNLAKAPLWESGELQPTWKDLRNLANKYKRPPIFYLMSEPPEDEDDQIIEFRAPEKIKDYSPALRLEIRKSKYRRNAFISLNNEMGFNLTNFSKQKINSNNSSLFAKKLREILDVPVETQKKWIFNDNGQKKYNHSIFLYKWKEIVYNLGILVFETEDVSEKEMSGLSLYNDICPIILLNGKNNHNRRIFTLIHELAHIFMGESTICDVDKKNQKESFCNKVAAEVLVPSPLKDEQVFYKKGTVKVGPLSHEYGISKQAIVIRLYSLNKVSKEFKDQELHYIELYNKDQKRKQKERNKLSKGGGMSAIDKKKKYEGKAYSRFILNAYENKIISPTKFMRYLDLPVDAADSLYELVSD
ncbi:ImmA/IrrE family metallo-endopeptidase [Methanobacterium subterraneum]|uniref:ImmA/IrrE family metallo-endopeptidase n=1 Tax=Methanobacterium subterraneum TaxID=59277 RepID=A0A7K4DMD1_9EURY|nr:ImmA/IrrE family metallo-endopeptidase [Methanobacterium subterraneum]NMO09498.1 ImmA/IrrE family metallo-endopeptidase [Methanobacterium subterraneum]